MGLDLSCLVVHGDRQARRRAGESGLRMTGTRGILRELHRLGFAARPIKDDPRALEDAGMRIAPERRHTVVHGDAGAAGGGTRSVREPR